MACSGSSQVENATGGLPCLRRENLSSSAAATVRPLTTSAAAGSWKTALTPRTLMLPEEKRLCTLGTGLATPSEARNCLRQHADVRAPTRRSAGVLGDRAEPLEGAPDEPGDVHLGDADPLGDLGLGEVLDEAEVQHDAVARRERLERRRDRRAVLDELEAVVLDPDRLGVGLAVPLVAEAVGLERDGVVGRGRLHRLEHLLRGD